MIGNRLEGVRLLKVWVQAAAVFCTFWFWYVGFFSLYAGGSLPSPAHYTIYSVIAFGAVIFERLLRDHSKAIAPAYQSHERSVLITARQTGFVACAFLLVAFIAKDKTISRAFILSLLAVLPASLLLANHYILPRLTRQFFLGNRRLRTVLIGEPAEVRRNLEWFRKQESLGMEIVGYIGNGVDGVAIDGIAHLGARTELESTLKRIGPSTAVFLDPPDVCTDLIAHKEIGDNLGIRIVHVWDFQAHFGIVPILHTESGLQFLGFLSEPLESPFNRLAKRVFDIAVALPVCLFVLPPLALCVWLTQRSQSPGSLFFVQDRRGQEGRTFRMLKFRTMREDNPDEARQATREDGRVFSAGRILRKLSIDEFPQFINVLLGDMSIVGPRPHLADHDERFATVFHGYRLRSFVKPGITGLAQVRGFRGLVEEDSDVQKRAESDLQYLEHWSLILDATIVLRTFAKLFHASKNAL
ncbi:MAG: exopolysaccharide biosynthesis polyprenyl glycosylphosphotransferase [Verrucomicrobiota bacterium]